MAGANVDIEQQQPEEPVERPELDALVQHVNDSDLSSIKSVVSGILNIIDNPRSTAKDLKDIIAIDPPLSAKVLMVANSSYYGARRRISEIEQAVIWIGFDALKEMALSQKVCEIFDRGESVEGYSRVLLWRHSVAVALLGKMIYRREFGERGENAYAAGLLHDIGIIVEDQFRTDLFKQALRRSREERITLQAAENSVLGFNHTEVGREITAGWAFPEELTQAIACHHHPDRAVGEAGRLATTLCVADTLSRRVGIGYNDSAFSDPRLYQECLRKLDLREVALDLIVKEMKVEFSRMEARGLF